MAFNILFSYKKSAQQVGVGYHEVFGLVRWPKKNSHQKNCSKQPKIDYKEQKMDFNILFSYIKSAQQVGQGYYEVFGLVRLPKKNSHQKNSSKQPKIDYTEQNRAYNVVFSDHINNKKSAQQVGLGYHEVFGLVRWPKKNSHQKNRSKQPKIDYKEQKMAFNILFSYKYSAQEVGQGNYKVFRLI